MSGKFVSGQGGIAIGAAMIAALAATGCGSGGYVARHSPAMRPGEAGHSHEANSGAQNQARAKAKAEVTNCVDKQGAAGMQSSASRTAAIDCMKDLVPPDKRAALETCLSHAVVRDNVYIASGREAFESKDGPDCVNAAR